VKKAGRRLRTGHLEVRATDSLLSHARVVVIVAKHGHTIVERNKLRRRLRELVRIRIIPQLAGTDLVVRSLTSAYEATFAELAHEMETIAADLSTKRGT
jgi:ribonuclease P protein component